jgi:predicted MarR family transcription regulator
MPETTYTVAEIDAILASLLTSAQDAAAAGGVTYHMTAQGEQVRIDLAQIRKDIEFWQGQRANARGKTKRSATVLARRRPV